MLPSLSEGEEGKENALLSLAQKTKDTRERGLLGYPEKKEKKGEGPSISPSYQKKRRGPLSFPKKGKKGNPLYLHFGPRKERGGEGEFSSRRKKGAHLFSLGSYREPWERGIFSLLPGGKGGRKEVALRSR